MNIIVLAGGYSSERDVSLMSGSKVVAALRRKGHKVMLLDPYIGLERCGSFDELYSAYAKEEYDFGIPASEPDLVALKQSFGRGNAMLGQNVLEACTLCDVVFVALHGSVGENGQLQAALDLFDVKYTGSGYIGCSLSMDKSIAKEIMDAHGITTPKSSEYFLQNLSQEQLFEVLQSHTPPYVVKPANGGSSLGVTIVQTKNDIPTALKYAKTYEDKIIVEEYITGREFTAGVLDGKTLPVIEIMPKSGFFDYTNKYQDGLTDELCPAPIDDELAEKIKQTALQAHNALRLGGYSRADFIVTPQGQIYCLEVNSLPGLTPASLVPKEAAHIGIEYDDLCEKIVELALQ
ncbi:MAG: D-alanine--D-alanine ligase [Oscillospiraceae bacterium]|jgi:D-alanine-D-alanine ligase|nr:D-alanine--D-alanine ligase [Oscillospiraceae bacterium]